MLNIYSPFLPLYLAPEESHTAEPISIIDQAESSSLPGPSFNKKMEHYPFSLIEDE